VGTWGSAQQVLLVFNHNSFGVPVNLLTHGLSAPCSLFQPQGDALVFVSACTAGLRPFHGLLTAHCQHGTYTLSLTAPSCPPPPQVSVMEDEGTLADHLSGVSATDGQWHHVAVTWESRTGTTILYLDSREVWRVTRGKGKRIPSGGTLVIGREQVRVGALL
jgi:hypothetical protein